MFNSENTKKALTKQTNIEVVKDIYEYTKEMNFNILKIIICDESKIVFHNILKKLKRIIGIEVLDIEHMSKKMIKIGTENIPVEYFYTEISSKNVDKWNALEFLIEKLNISKEETMCIGDNINDKKMVENAGLGVVMKNSALASQKIGDYVTEYNNSNGVEKAIYQYIQ